MFQISALYDVRNPIKDTPVHHLQVGSLEDMCVSSTLLSWSWETIPNWLLKHQNPSTVCKILMYRNTWLINYTVCPSYLYPPGGGRGGVGRSCSWADKYAEGFHFLNEPFPMYLLFFHIGIVHVLIWVFSLCRRSIVMNKGLSRNIDNRKYILTKCFAFEFVFQVFHSR